MGAPLPQSVRDAMLARANKIKEQQAKAQSAQFTRVWNLGGKQAIVAPGHSIVVRLMPRWDRYVVDGAGKVTPDLAALEKPIYVEAMEHWWDTPEGKTTREWCPQMYGDKCPVCEAAEELKRSANSEDRDLARRIGAKEVAVFNAAVGATGQRKFGDDGKLDVRPMSVPGTVFLYISNIMTGGEQESFARGDVSDPAVGYDLELVRPAGQGQRWVVNCAPDPTRLFLPAEKDKFAGWWTLIYDLDALLEQETKTWEVLYKEFHGVDPEGAAPPAAQQPPPRQPAPAAAARTAAPAPVEEDPIMGGGGDGLDGLGDGADDFPTEPSAPAARPPAARQPAPAQRQPAAPPARTRKR